MSLDDGFKAEERLFNRHIDIFECKSITRRRE
jgi:hypothetical protein